MKKFLTNRKQHDKVSKLSETAQVSEAHETAIRSLATASLIKRDS